MVIDLQVDIKSLKLAKNEYLCVLGDLNETIRMDPDLMANICVENDLYDVLPSRYPHQHNTPTYHRGSSRLDYILLSNNTPTPLAMGHNPYNLIYTSDHRAMFIDLPIDITISNLTPSELREIHSDSVKVKDFIITIHQH